MNIEGADLQALSRCEALMMQRDIGTTIIKAYEAGMNTVMQNYDKPVDEFLDANFKALRAFFPNLPFQTAAGMLAFQLREKVKAEGDV